MWLKSCLFALVLWLCSSSSHCQLPGCISPPGIVMTPSTNQTVPINTNTIITYSCNVDKSRQANWELMGIQIPVGSVNRDELASRGINITSGSNASEVFISINRAGRGTFENRDLSIACYALDTVELEIKTGCSYYVRTYEAPGIPEKLDFNPVATNLSRLVLTWDQPDNTLIDTGDPVVTTYTVTVSGPTFDFTDTTTNTRYEIVDSLDEECAEHNFQVHASNGAGVGPADFINETIPISPDIRDLSAQLTVTDIVLTTPLSIEISFLRAVACSPNFPLNSYEVNFIGVDTVKFPVTDPRIVGKELITLEVTSNLTQPDQDYSLSVSACISVTCRESRTVTFRTTDVQSANIVFFENNLYLTCSFASSSPARGCGFIFTASSNITEEFNVSQSESGLCTQLQNMENVYTSIVALDWESDGSYGNLLTVPTRNRTMTEEEFMATTGCTLPIVVTGLSVGGIVGIVIAVAVVAAVIITIIVIVAVIINKKKVYLRCEVEDLHALDAGGDETDGPSDPQNAFEFRLEEGHSGGTITFSRAVLEKMLSSMESDNKSYRILSKQKK